LSAVPGPASARADYRPAVQRTTDRTGDVRRIAERNGHEVITLAPHRRIGDIESLRVRYREHNVALRIKTTELRPNRSFYGATFQFRDSGGHTATAGVFAFADNPRGLVFLERDGRDVTCPGIRHRTMVRDGVFKIWVPRACLGSPDWVRVRAAVVIGDFGAKGDVFYADVAPGGRLRGSGYLPRAWHPGS
jgi:hypothetical protein